VMATGKKVIKDIVSHSIKFAAFLLTSYWLLYPDGLISQFLNVNLSFLLLPLIILSTALYVSAVINAIFISRITEIIGKALEGLSIALAIYLLTPRLASDLLSSLNYWLLILALTAIFNYVTNSLADLYHEPLLNVFSTSLSLFLAGFSLSNILAVFAQYLPPPLENFPPEIVFWGFTAAAAVSTVSIFRNFSNPYLHFLGVKIDSNIAGITLLLILTLTYFSALRPYVMSYLTPIPVSLIEWGVICLSFWLFYRNLRSQVNKRLTEPLRVGDWTKLRQEVEYHVDSEQVNVADLVGEFVDYGIKDGIITYLVSVMLSNGVSEDNVRGIVRRLIEYEDIPYPKICLKPWINGIDEENKRRRRDLLQEILSEIEREIKAAERLWLPGIKHESVGEPRRGEM